MNPRVFQCPRCGAPLSHDISAKAGPRTTCNFCGAAIDLGGDTWAKAYQRELVRPKQPDANAGSAPAPQAPPAFGPSPPSPFFQRLAWVLRAVFGLILGFGLVQALLAFKNNGLSHPIPIAAGIGASALILQAIGFRIGAVALMFVGALLLLLKPFVNPVVWSDGHIFGITSQTHLNYLVPAGILIVIASIVALAIQKNAKIERNVYIVCFTGLVLGAALPLASANLSGPTRGQVLKQYQSRFEPLRRILKEIHAQLPPAGSLQDEKARRDLNPLPEFQKNSKNPPNTEIIPASQLLDQSDKGQFDLLLSDDLARALLWTSDKNPMAFESMNESDSAFAGELESALKIRWLAVYRPAGRSSSYGGSMSADALEIFVFDLQTNIVVAQGLTGPITTYSDGRDKVARTLERITGGRFSF